jgi:hypothetical protein
VHKRLEYAAIALLLGIVSGLAGHWLITPHPDASAVRTVLVVAQLLGGCSFFLWALWKVRQLGRMEGAENGGGR